MSYNWDPRLYPTPINPGVVIYDIATEYQMPNPPVVKSTPTTRLPKTNASHHYSSHRKTTGTKHTARHTGVHHTGTHHTGSHKTRKAKTHKTKSPTAIYHAAVKAADLAAGLHKGSYSWFTNLGVGLKGDRVGYNTGVIPPSAPAPVDYVTPGTINDSNAFPNGQPKKIPKAKWPSATTGPSVASGFAFPSYKLTAYYAGPHLRINGGHYYYTSDPNPVSYIATLSGGNETDKLLYGSNESLTYAELVDPALHYKSRMYHPKKAKGKHSRSKHPRSKHPRSKGTKTPALGKTTAIPAPFHAAPPAPVASRVPSHIL